MFSLASAASRPRAYRNMPATAVSVRTRKRCDDQVTLLGHPAGQQEGDISDDGLTRVQTFGDDIDGIATDDGRRKHERVGERHREYGAEVANTLTLGDSPQIEMMLFSHSSSHSKSTGTPRWCKAMGAKSGHPDDGSCVILSVSARLRRKCWCGWLSSRSYASTCAMSEPVD